MSNDGPVARSWLRVEAASASEDDLAWADAAIFTAEDSPPPRLAVGDEVVVAFEGGDLSRPIVLERIWVGEG